jgi:hypothetical protein
MFSQLHQESRYGELNGPIENDEDEEDENPEV